MTGRPDMRSPANVPVEDAAPAGRIDQPAVRPANVVRQDGRKKMRAVAQDFFKHDRHDPDAAKYQHGVQKKSSHNSPQCVRFESLGSFNHFSETVL